MWDGINRRKFPRAHFPCKIIILSSEHPKSLTTKTENIGCGGVCVVLPKPLKLFSIVGIQLFLEEKSSPIECSGRIVWVVGRKSSKSFKPESFDTGIEFVDIKEEDIEKIAKLVEKLSKEK